MARLRVKSIESILAVEDGKRLVRQLSAFDLVLELGAGGAAVASGWSGYFSGIMRTIGLPLPELLTRVPADGGIADVPAIAICLFVTILLVVGTKESARLNAILVAVKVLAI